MQRRLFLHAGTHKTGTTSIQRMLLERRFDADAVGVRTILDHPSNRTERTNCKSIACAFIRPALIIPARISGNCVSQFGHRDVINCLYAQLSAPDRHTFVVSAEAFCYLRTAGEGRLLSEVVRRAGCELVPIVYLRNEPDWRASWESQCRNTPHVRAFMERHPDRFTLLNDWYFDRNAIAEFWRSIAPDTVVLDYDAELAACGSVLPSFLRTVGLPDSFASDKYRLNKRPAARVLTGV